MAEASLSPHRADEIQPASTFQQTWSPSTVDALDPSQLQLPKVRRAWERKAQSPSDKDARYRKVWKRYGLRTPSGESVDAVKPRPANSKKTVKTDSRERAVKRLCLKEEGDDAQEEEDTERRPSRVQYAGTKYDRRKSGYTRASIFRTLYALAVC